MSTHKSRILERQQLANLAALIRYGMEQGLATDDGLAVWIHGALEVVAAPAS